MRGRPKNGRPHRGMRATTPRATKSPTIRDLEWAAGFLEGEGNFCAAGMPSGYFSARVCAGQVNPEPLLRLQEFFGGTVRADKFVNNRSNRRQVLHRWNVYGVLARGVMMTLYVLLSQTKQQQIRWALEAA